MNFPSTYKKTPNFESPSKHKLKVCKFVIQYLVVSYWKNTESKPPEILVLTLALISHMALD